ncbi:MAG: hypothetical protein V4719_26580 [Planctomycetota bacterium]
MRILQTNNRYNHKPFTGRGASLYAGVGDGPDAVQFRKLRILGCRFVRGSGFTISNGLKKACILAQAADPTNNLAYTVPPEWQDQTVWIQVRTFWDHVENTHNFDPLRLGVDDAGEIVPEIHGEGKIIAADKRDGGIYAMRVAYIPTTHGTPPDELVIRKTAGPGSLADVATEYDSIQNTRNYTIETEALTDAATYTFALIAKSGSTELQLDTITFVADAAGPPTPTGLTLTAY